MQDVDNAADSVYSRWKCVSGDVQVQSWKEPNTIPVLDAANVQSALLIGPSHAASVSCMGDRILDVCLVYTADLPESTAQGNLHVSLSPGFLVVQIS